MSLPPADDSAGHAMADRLDKWLWAVRVFKTRPLATEACRKGHIEINGLCAKPAREVHPGELVTIRQDGITRTLKALAVPRSRIGAKVVAEYCTDLTPPAEWDKLRERSLQRVVPREQGSGRPTKRDRRILDRLLG